METPFSSYGFNFVPGTKRSATCLLALLLSACSGSSPESQPSVFMPVPVADVSVSSMLVVRTSQNVSAAPGIPVMLAALVLEDGIPLTAPVVQWELLSGTGSALITSPFSTTTSVVFDSIGQYVLKLTATDGVTNTADTIVVTVIDGAVSESPILDDPQTDPQSVNPLSEEPAAADPLPDEPVPDEPELEEPIEDEPEPEPNTAPEVDAGHDVELALTDVLALSAEASDDGYPDNILYVQWRQDSGPGTATFGEPGDLTTTVTFDRAGTYLLRLTASDGELETSDRLRAIVNDVVEDDPVPGSNRWHVVQTSNGSRPVARHEAGGVAIDNIFYLLGGRGNRPVNRYDPVTNRWENLGNAPREINHFQPVVHQGKIFVVSALSCCYPSENVIDRIQIYNPETRRWTQGSTIPANRRRGSAGVVVRNNRFYVVGGSTNGHDGGMVNWFDEYNPATNSWRTLPNAPTKRDHFGAALVGNKLVAAGGRRTNHPNTFGDLVGKVDVFNFATNRWESDAPNIPTRRAGAVVVARGNEVFVIGGETAQSGSAETVVEAYNVNTRRWRTLPSMNQSRHSGGVAIIGDTLHVASGAGNRGGSPELTSHEKLQLQ